MQLLYYAIFAGVSWLLLMQIFRFSTYHKFFNKAVVFLIGFSILNGYLLFYFDMHPFFLWHLPVFLFFFYNNYKKQKKASSNYEHLIDEQAGMTREFFELSLEKTLKYYIISAILYLLIFSLSYLYFYNS